MMLLETTLRQHWKLSFELFIRNGIDMGWLKLSRWEDENQTVVLLNPVENVNLHIIMWNLSRSSSTIIINIETIQELTRKQRQYYQVNWITQMRRIFNHSFTSNTHRVTVIWNGLPMFVINRCVWQNNQIDWREWWMWIFKMALHTMHACIHARTKQILLAFFYVFADWILKIVRKNLFITSNRIIKNIYKGTWTSYYIGNIVNEIFCINLIHC